MLNDERIGKFEIDTGAIEDPGRRAPLFRLFSYMIVLRAEALLYKNAVEYVAISALFEPRHSGEIVPEYQIVFENQGQQIRAVRKDRGKPVRLMTLDPDSEG